MSSGFDLQLFNSVIVTLLVIMNPPGAVLLVTRIAGLLLSAIAVQMVANSVRAFVATAS